MIDGYISYLLCPIPSIEFRKELVDEFHNLYPEDQYKQRVTIWQGDIFEECRKLITEGKTYDVVGVLGIYYHIMDHYLLLKMISNMKPRTIILDSEFWLANFPMIGMVREATDKQLNSASHFQGQKMAPIGIPSRKALELMADTLGYSVEWLDWNEVPAGKDRKPLFDYFREEGVKRRYTVVLRPI